MMAEFYPLIRGMRYVSFNDVSPLVEIFGNGFVGVDSYISLGVSFQKFVFVMYCDVM